MGWVQGIASLHVCRYDTLVVFGRHAERTRTAADLGELDGEKYPRVQAGTGKGKSKSQIGITIGR